MKKVASEGFSLVELMVVIAIIAILMAVAVPMYANYTVRSKLSSELEKLGAVKAAAEYISNNNNSIDYTGGNLGVLPSGASIGENGTIELDTSSIVANSSISLVPSIGIGTIDWSCSGTGLTSSQLPSSCQNDGEANNNSNGGEGISSNQFDGNSCGFPDVEGASCYEPNNNINMRVSGDQIEIKVYNGAADEDGFRDGIDMSMNSEVPGEINYIGNEGPQSITSIAGVDDLDLPEEQKQNVVEAINSIKQTSYCDDAANSDLWVCQ
ncbi:pilin [Francisella adeliensis]|uniref:Pilin n=1 Tax=Francisella adeliensis TaxID=2007306 RepID=A0A2Z4XY79_9GAMM|nr:hypothetical protein CDH04_05240 [Francisella adeliensis]MBK2085759.1 pilin [Francisella adeliensis]MBK2097637.1 pilin [Francisella adeliensis]QIW12094.1 pilin [Francisella adeliensis]QIW13968.1 pilin [Francisella adeliensis]